MTSYLNSSDLHAPSPLVCNLVSSGGDIAGSVDSAVAVAEPPSPVKALPHVPSIVKLSTGASFDTAMKRGDTGE